MARFPSSPPAHGPSETHITPQNSSHPHLSLLQPLPGVSALGRTRVGTRRSREAGSTLWGPRPLGWSLASPCAQEPSAPAP